MLLHLPFVKRRTSGVYIELHKPDSESVTPASGWLAYTVGTGPSGLEGWAETNFKKEDYTDASYTCAFTVVCFGCGFSGSPCADLRQSDCSSPLYRNGWLQAARPRRLRDRPCSRFGVALRNLQRQQLS